MEDNCEPKIHDIGHLYTPADSTINIDGAWNFEVENKSNNVVIIDDTIDLQPFGNPFSVRKFNGNSVHKYKGKMKIAWAAGAGAADTILVKGTYDAQ